MSSKRNEMSLLFLLLPLQMLVCSAGLQDNLVVKTEHGLVLGTPMTTSTGKIIYGYIGVPYAEAIIGNLKFKPPVKRKPWLGVFPTNVLDGPLPCPQPTYPNSSISEGSEDCLMVNVYTPQSSNNSTKLPVLVYIHGGMFFTGGISPAAKLGPGYILNKNVVLVTLQYRLGVLGFLSTGDSAAPGNNGLLDQNLALQWVKKNIASFGGDPNRVTLYGQGAGAASVTYHMLSPLSKGLFQAAICESGTALTPRSHQDTPLKWAQQLGLSFNCPIKNNFKLVACLNQQSSFSLVGQANIIFNSSVIPINVFNPVVEPKGTKGAFLTKSPFKLLKNGNFAKVPLIIGMTKNEGGGPYAAADWRYNHINNAFFKSSLPFILNNLTNIYKNAVKVSYAIKTKYFDAIDVNNQNEVISTAIDLNSDMLMNAPTELTVSYISKYSTVYTYVFNYAGSCSKTSYGGQLVVDNGDDLCYIFQPLLNPTIFNANDLAMSNKFVDWLTTFATTLAPTSSQWSATPSQNISYLRINSATDLSMQTNYRTDQVNFWNVQVPAIINA